jgi:hypothetical protein
MQYYLSKHLFWIENIWLYLLIYVSSSTNRRDKFLEIFYAVYVLFTDVVGW